MSDDEQGQQPDAERPTRSDMGTFAESPGDATRPYKHLGDFDLLREIGRGGMGVVYEARQISLKRRVALKVLPPGLGLTDQAVQRFEREAQAAAKLHHTNIVPVYATGEDGGCHYYAMELVEGQSLSRVLDDLRGQQSNPLIEATVTQAAAARLEPPADEQGSVEHRTSLSDTGTSGRQWFDTVAKLLADVGDALHYAHDQGVIHRDVKPANLLLSRDGRLCLGDFGLARVTQEPGMTVSGSFLGTPAYMSPEQVAAGRVKLDHRTDIYSLGVVLYEMLTLQRPFPGDSREQILTGILSKDPKLPRRVNPRVPTDLETICLKAIEKDPDRRYATAGEMAADLRRYLQRGLITARRAGPVRRLGKLLRRHPIATTIAAATVIILVLAGLAWQLSGEKNREAVARAMAQARIDMNAGEYRAALGKIDEALAIDPSLAPARLVRARVLLQLGRAREAVEIAQDLLERESDDWTAHLILAAAAMERRMDPVAAVSGEEHVQAVERLAPETPEAYYLRALMLDSSADAVELLDRALEIAPGHVDALIERIHRRISLKNFGAALADCERLVALRPRSPIGRNLMAAVYLAQHDPERALAEAERAIRLDPEDPTSYNRRASVYEYMGQEDDAIADLSRVIELSPDRGEPHVRRARLHAGARDFDLAEAEARHAIEVEPESPRSYVELVFLYGQRQENDALEVVIQQIEQTLTGMANPRWRAQWHAAIALWRLWWTGDPEQAMAHADRAIELDGNAWMGHVARAGIFLAGGDAERFTEECERAAAIELTDPQDLERRAQNMSNHCRRTDLVLADYSRAIELAPWWADSHRGRGDVYRQQGRYAESLADLEQAVELAPRWGEAFYSRGQTHAAMGRFEEALADYEKAEEVGVRSWVYAGNQLKWEQAQVLGYLGREDEGLELLDRMVASDPESYLGRFRRAEFLLHLGRVEDALADLDAAVNLNPGIRLPRVQCLTFLPDSCDRIEADLEVAVHGGAQFAGGWNDFAWTHVAHLVFACPRLYDAKLALEYARRADAGATDVLAVRDTLGLALYRNGLYEEAREVLQDLLDVQPRSYPPTFFSLAMTSWKLGHQAKARRHYERGSARLEEMWPNDPESLRLRDEAARVLGIER